MSNSKKIAAKSGSKDLIDALVDREVKAALRVKSSVKAGLFKAGGDCNVPPPRCIIRGHG